MRFEDYLSGDPRDKDWQSKAACRDDHTTPDVLEGDVVDQRTVIGLYCRRRVDACPVQLPCALEGLNYSTGSFGGMTTREFNIMRPLLKKIAGKIATEAELVRQHNIAVNNNPVSIIAFPEA